ncbi:hypothetical protein LZ30DRAFT_818385 [Colletotrichum cereale]|nr:hypothetical protein LZ30DRAFT_818385 [Colletotrichum cereale]
MSSHGSDSSGGNAYTTQHQSQIPNLNPSARSFTPTDSNPSSATSSGFGYLAYHQTKAVEAANVVAQVLPHLSYRFDRQRTSEQGDQKNHTEIVTETEHTTPKSSPEPQLVDSAGFSAGLDAPKTPPGRHIKTRRTNPTPAAYTFDDDEEFYPGTNTHTKRNARSVRC